MGKKIQLENSSLQTAVKDGIKSDVVEGDNLLNPPITFDKQIAHYIEEGSRTTSEWEISHFKATRKDRRETNELLEDLLMSASRDSTISGLISKKACFDILKTKKWRLCGCSTTRGVLSSVSARISCA